MELDKDLAEELDQIQLPKDLEDSSNKRALEEIKEISVGTFATIAYGILSKKACNSDKIDTSDNSTREPVSSLVIK